MAKFTVFFKDIAINSAIFDSGVIHIGRDETNDIAVNSLAVAPAHSAVILKYGNALIKQLNDNFPLIVNGQKLKECQLKNNDKITLGKHAIVFNTTEEVFDNHSQTVDPDVEFLNKKIKRDLNLPEANLQIIDGKHIGRILPMNKAMTRLGRNGSGVIVIARRKDGYFISALENNMSLTVNNEPLEDKMLRLSDNDIIVIDNTSLQFFQTHQ